MGYPKLLNRKSADSGPKFAILRRHMEEILLFNKFFFELSTHALVAKTQREKVVRWCADGDFWPYFCVQYFQHISDLHSKCALRPHHV